MTNLPVRPFPVTCQDTGSGGTTRAVTGLVFVYGPTPLASGDPGRVYRRHHPPVSVHLS